MVTSLAVTMSCSPGAKSDHNPQQQTLQFGQHPFPTEDGDPYEFRGWRPETSGTHYAYGRHDNDTGLHLA